MKARKAGVASLDSVATALAAGHYEDALTALQGLDATLRAACTQDRPPDLSELRQLHDGMQGMLAVVASLREEAYQQLQHLHRGRAAVAEYAAH